MKIIRSAKCSLRFSTEKKKNQLNLVLAEYGKVVNIFIDHFWLLEKLPGKTDLLKDIVDIPLEQTWLSARLRKVAAREAIDLILSVKAKKKGKKSKPKHRGQKMSVSCTIADLQLAKDAHNFDAWLHVASVGNKVILDLPVKFHKQYNKWNNIGKRVNAYIVPQVYLVADLEAQNFKFRTNEQHRTKLE